MSNNPSQRVVMRLQPAALVFVVLALVIGAMLMASNNIDPNSVKRAQFSPTPVDYFAAIKYSNWKSPDGLLQIDYPSTWTAQTDPNGTPFQYLIVTDSADGPFITMSIAQLSSVQTASDILTQILSSGTGTAQPTPTINPVEYGGLRGASTLQTIPASNSLGEPVMRNSDWIVLNLDTSHVLLIRAVSDTNDWLKMQSVTDHMMNSLTVDKAAAIRQLDAALAAQNGTSAATPNAASAASAAATSAAPSAAPSAATPAPTAATPAATAGAVGTKSF